MRLLAALSFTLCALAPRHDRLAVREAGRDAARASARSTMQVVTDLPDAPTRTPLSRPCSPSTSRQRTQRRKRRSTTPGLRRAAWAASSSTLRSTPPSAFGCPAACNCQRSDGVWQPLPRERNARGFPTCERADGAGRVLAQLEIAVLTPGSGPRTFAERCSQWDVVTPAQRRWTRRPPVDSRSWRSRTSTWRSSEMCSRIRTSLRKR